MSFWAMGTGTDEHPNRKNSPFFITTTTAIILFTIAPVAVTLFLIFVVIGEYRRVRLSRWALATTIASILSFIAAGFTFSQWLIWLGSGFLALWGTLLPLNSPFSLITHLATTAAATTLITLIIQHILISIPLALAAMTLWWWWRSYSLRLRGENEGEHYSHHRPVGWLDRRRIAKNTLALQTGHWATNHPEEIAIGIGHYGEIATATLDDFKKASLIVGTSQSGKTRQANSIVAQQVINLGSGNITIDLKDDDNLAAAKADLAQQQGVPFLHFKLLSRTGGSYKPPHPYAPDWPAHYDPLQRGNGASKAAMLLNSVPRDGDAAVYARTANEAVKLAFDIAALTGYDQQRTRHGHPISGFAVLARMLDPETLIKTGRSVTIDQIRHAHPFLTEQAAETKVAAIHERVESFNHDLKRTNSTLSSALGDVRSTVASYVNDSAAGPFLTPGTRPALRIDLVRAILRNEIIVFSLPAQEYPEMASMIATMVLLDLQNAVATLRTKYTTIATHTEKTTTPGALLWNPLILQIEEISAIHSPAAAEAMLGLFNKSADVGIRPILSTQSLADIEAVDGTGVWLRQLLAQLDHLITLQLSESHDAEKIAAFSGIVSKKIAAEQKGVYTNRTGLFQGAKTVGHIIAHTEDRTRIGEGEALQLGRVTPNHPGEMLWITKTPQLSAVHTTTPEGPNNWSEKLLLIPVHEKPHRWDPYSTKEHITQARTERDDTFYTLTTDLAHNELLFAVIDGIKKQEAINIEAQSMPLPTTTPPPPTTTQTTNTTEWGDFDTDDDPLDNQQPTTPPPNTTPPPKQPPPTTTNIDDFDDDDFDIFD